MRVKGAANSAHLLDRRMVRVYFARMASPAGAKASALRRLGQGEEDDVLPMRAPAGARGSAIDSGGAHGKDKGAVKSWVARQHDLPFIVSWPGPAFIVIHFPAPSDND